MYIFRLPAQQIIVHSHYKRFMPQVLPFKEAQDRIIAWKQYGVYTHNSILLLLYNTYLIIRISFFSMVMPLFILQLDTITSIFCLIYLPIETYQAELPIGCVWNLKSFILLFYSRNRQYFSLLRSWFFFLVIVSKCGAY